MTNFEMMTIDRLKVRTRFITLLITFILSFDGYGQAHLEKQRSLRMLVIGNSFSQNATTYLPQMAKEGGYDIVIGHAEIGGCSLQKHWELAELNRLDPKDPKGKPYLGNRSLRTLLSEQKWDLITMQQYSGLSGNVDSYRPYAADLYKLIRQLQPTSRILMHQTWAYRSDSKTFTEIVSGKFARTEKEMYESSRAAYHQIANELGISIIPTGDAFWLISSDRRSAYIKDESFNSETALYPALPDQINSLNVGYTWIDNKLNFDTHHANDAGKFLAGLVWYRTLFKRSVKSMKFKPESISVVFADRLKMAATR